MYKHIQFGLVSLLGLLAVVGSAEACSTPVFRYALERWRPDFFELFVVHKGPLSKEHEALVQELQGGEDFSPTQPNCDLRKIDMDEELSESEKAITKDIDLSHGPVVVVWPPWTEKPLFRALLTKSNVSALLESPVRRALARRFLQGDSAVCLLFLTGDKKKDDAYLKRLTVLAKKLEKTVQLSEPVEDDPLAPPSIPSEGLPELKLAFSVLPISANDPQELFLRKMVEATAVEEREGPMVCWVFGRTRFLPAIGLDDEDAEEILEQDAIYLCGPCSCQVKAQNPGADLLSSVFWDGFVVGEYTLKADLPEVKNGASLETMEMMRERLARKTSPSYSISASDPPADSEEPNEENEQLLPKSVLWGLGGIAAFVFVGSCFILLRKGGESA